MLLEAFKNNIYPYMIQIGKILFIVEAVQLAYMLLREGNWRMFWDKSKAAVSAYIIISGSFAILNFIDKVTANMK